MKIPARKVCDICSKQVSRKEGRHYKTLRCYTTMSYEEKKLHICRDCLRELIHEIRSKLNDD